jgi:hypothetical protein
VENVQLLDEAESHEQQPATDKKVLKAYQLSNGRFWRKAGIGETSDVPRMHNPGHNQEVIRSE